MPEPNQPNSLQFSDLNKKSSPDHQPPPSKAAAAANELYDQANGSATSNEPVKGAGELQAGVPVSLNVTENQADAPLPKMNQSHEFGPIAPTISTEIPSMQPKTYEKTQNPLEVIVQTSQAEAGQQQASTENESRLKRLAKLLRLSKIFSKRNMTYLGIGIASFLVFYLIFNFQNIMLQINYALHKPQAEPAISVPDATQLAQTPEAQSVPAGNIIIIPKINVNAPIVFEPSSNEQAIQVALRSGVVHYAQTGTPGQPGNAVIVGHSSMDPWSPGKYKFIFALLEKIGVGDQIQINYEQKKYIYQVTETKVVAPTDLSVLAQTNEHTLTLITCTPAGTNWRRFIVHAKQVEPLPVAKIAIKDSAGTPTAPATDLPGKSPFFLDKIRDFFKHLFGQ